MRPFVGFVSLPLSLSPSSFSGTPSLPHPHTRTKHTTRSAPCERAARQRLNDKAYLAYRSRVLPCPTRCLLAKLRRPHCASPCCFQVTLRQELSRQQQNFETWHPDWSCRSYCRKEARSALALHPALSAPPHCFEHNLQDMSDVLQKTHVNNT